MVLPSSGALSAQNAAIARLDDPAHMYSPGSALLSIRRGDEPHTGARHLQLATCMLSQCP